jgi:sugar fermentation stimulation protein A
MKKMKFGQTLQPGRLIVRYKRFLADVAMDDGRLLTVHCPNSGSMSGCREPGSPVLVSLASNPKRKYAHTLEMVRVGTTWVGINTARTNGLVAEAIRAGVVVELAGIETIRPEVKVSDESRLDFLLSRGEEKIYLEVKNCSLALDRAAVTDHRISLGREYNPEISGLRVPQMRERGLAAIHQVCGQADDKADVVPCDRLRAAMFPDAVTVRGAKHLGELLALRRTGCRAVVFFCVQREDVDYFSPADHIDPGYAKALREVAVQGVEVLAYGASLSPEAITIVRRLPVRLGS